jgi:DNA repair protein RecN (Recombination protein N)
MPNDLPEKWAEIQEQVTAIKNSQDLGALEQNLSKTLAAYLKSAKKLSQERIAAAKTLERLVTAAMQDLAMRAVCLQSKSKLLKKAMLMV